MLSIVPSWLTDLREEPALAGFSWIDDDQAARIRAEWLDIWSQVEFEKAFHDPCRERLSRCVPVAVGPSRARRLSKTSSSVTMVFDPEHPDDVAFSLSHAMPSACWSMARVDEIAEVLSPYLEPQLAHDRVERLVKPLDIQHPQTIASAIDALELWVDDAFWGSAHDADPWIGIGGDLSMLSLSVYVQRFGEQDPDRFPALGCRSLWSRSTMRIEQNPRGLFVFELRFRSAHDQRAIAQLNEMMSTHLPEDLPLDLAASLLRGGTLAARDVDELLRRGDSPFEALALQCAIAPSEPTTITRLRDAIAQHRESDEMLGGIASLASGYHHDGLLFEIADVADEPLRSEILTFLRPPT